MDQDRELQRAKWLLGAIGIFLISAFMSFDEFRYVLWGRTVDGRVVQAKEVEVAGRRGSHRPMLSVEYSFPNEAGGSLTERDLVPTDWPLPPEGRVGVQYVPGRPESSRLAGHRNMTWLVVFFISLAVASAFLFKLYLEAKATAQRPQRRARTS